MMQTQPFEKHVWAEIDLEALRHNFRAVKARAGACRCAQWSRPTATATVPCQCARRLRKRAAAGWP